MTQEDKEILLIDLCARLPYGVKCRVFLDIDNYIINESDKYSDSQLETINCLSETCTFTHLIGYNFGKFSIEHVKPYLRPMSSMTEEECDMVEEILGDNCIFDFMSNGDIILKQGQFPQKKLAKLYDYYNSIYIDYRGLIPIGLALEAPEGMYTLNK